MGSPTPSTPDAFPSAAPGPAVRVSAVMAGQEWVDPNGKTVLSPADGVHMELLCTDTGTPIASLFQTPDAAISLARLIQHHAVQLINAEVKDDGRTLSLPERLRRINAAHTGAIV